MRPAYASLVALASVLLIGVAGSAWAEGTGDARSGPVRLKPPTPKPEADAPAAETGVIVPAPRPDVPAGPLGPGDWIDGAAPGAGQPAVRVFDPTALRGVFAPYRISDGREIRHSLTGSFGDPAAGRTLFYNASRTGCSRCHGVPETPRPEGDESTGPDLWGVGTRLSEGHIRLWIVAPETYLPGTAMPAFHKPGQRDDPSDPLWGGPHLTAPEVEDVVAYLVSLTEGPPLAEEPVLE